MAEIRDEQGNPIPLTDELGRAVQLTDEHGLPIHLTGVATTGTEPKMHGGTHFTPKPAEPAVPIVGAPLSRPVTGGAAEEGEKQQLGKSGSSGSSSSEDDGQGGRRKKGWMQKIKEKLPGSHKNKEGEEITPEKVYTATTKVTVTTPAGPVDEPKTERIRVEHHEEEHEKKGLIDKIKDKLPGHHPH